MTELLLHALRVTVMALILAIGMGSTAADLTYLLRRPGLLVRSIVAMYVLVPLVVVAIVRFLTLPPAVEIALLVLAVSAGGLLLPRRLLGVGDGGYVFSLVVLSSLLAIVLVPAWLSWLGPLVGSGAQLRPIDVARVLGRFFLLPLLVGMALRWLAPGVSHRASERILAVGGVVLSACSLVLLATHGKLILEMGIPPLLTLAAVTLVALVIGHLLAGPDPGDQTVLAISCATRHLGLMVLVATSVPGPRVAALVVAYLVASALVTVPYLRWQRKRLSAASEQTP